MSDLKNESDNLLKYQSTHENSKCHESNISYARF
jgi:hypothetical protein